MKHFMQLMLGVATSAVMLSPALAADKVIVIVKATTSEYWQTTLTGARAAGEALGVEVEGVGPTAESDVAGEVALVENATTQKPSAIVVAPTNFEGLAAPIEAATAAGIPVIVIDAGVNTNQYASFVTTNNVEGGRKAAISLAKCIEERTGKAAGKVAYLTAIAGNESQISRDKGFLDEIAASYPDIEVVDNRIGDNDVAKGLSNTLDMLSRTPDLIGIFADNAIMGTGSGAALDEKGVGDTVCLVAFDADQGELDFLNKGVIYSVIVQDPYMMGYAGVWYGLAASKGVRLPKLVDTGVGVVTKADLSNPALAGLLDPSIRLLSPFVGD